MSRYTGPKLRIIRRLGDLPGLISGEKGGSQTRNYGKYISPGQHGHSTGRKLKTYARRLIEKQRLRFNYGISEKQMLNYVKLAKKMKGATSLNLLRLLEMRLDNIIFRLGLASTITAARQYVNHGHFNVNGSSVTIPGYRCRVKDTISLKENSKLLQKLTTDGAPLVNLDRPDTLAKKVPRHIEVISPSMTTHNGELAMAKILGIADRSSVLLRVNELYVVEFYSRRI
jgi:small subunit ribosomal protein S4